MSTDGQGDLTLTLGEAADLFRRCQVDEERAHTWIR